MLVGILNRSLRRRPILEEFEDRLVPASYLWMPDLDLNPNLNWNIKEHWWVWSNTANKFVEQGLNPLIPGGGDHVTFDGTHSGGAGNKDCVMNLARAVESVTVQSGYSKSITLQNTLDIEGANATGSGIFLVTNAPAASLRGSPGVATINMKGSSAFNWGAGTLENLFIFVTRADGKVATASVIDPGTTNHAMFGTVFHIDGQLNWQSGSVDVLQTGAASGINISSSGEFNIGVAGKSLGNRYWGVGADQSKYFQIQNSGTVTVNAAGGSATLRGDFTNANLTRLFAGTLDLTGDIAVQTAGVFSLHDGSTVRVSGSTQTLNIQEGLIRGHGTVDGNLKLGYDPALGPPPQSFASISPGFESGFPLVYTPGTITVTQSFAMFNSGNTMQIDVTQSGFDRVFVGGQATLNGGLTVNPSSIYHPPHPTSHAFLTAASIANDFVTKTVTYWGCWSNSANPGGVIKWKEPQKTATTYSLETLFIPGC